MTATKMSPCPFCQGAPSVSWCYSVNVACDNCYDGGGGLCGSDRDSEERAIVDWNTRVAEYDPGDAIEAAERRAHAAMGGWK